MNKTELIDSIANKAGVTRAVATSALDATLARSPKRWPPAMPSPCSASAPSRSASAPPRTGKNPATGEALEIAAAKVAKFSAGKALKDAVNK